MQHFKFSLKFCRRRSSLISYAMYVLCLTFAWVLIQPPYSVSDEPAHAIKAVASAYGQFDKPQVIGQFGYGAYLYEVPKVFTSIWHFTCYNSNTEITAACVGNFPTGSELVTATSSAGPYPPTYYLAVGWLGRIFPSQNGLYLMRLFGATLCSLLLVLAFYLQSQCGKNKSGGIGLILVITPAFSAFAAVVNPFALETATAVLFWTSAILFTDSTRAEKKNSLLMSSLLASALFFGFIRPAAFLLIMVAAFFIVISVPGKTFFSSVKKNIRNFYLIFAGVTCASFVSALWTFRSQTELIRDPENPVAEYVGSGGTILANMLKSFKNSGLYFKQMFGFFGWTSFYPPVLVSILFCLAVLVSLATRRMSSIRQKMGLALLTVFVVFAPTVLEGARAAGAGFFYQGRYMLPVAVGVPIYIWLRGDERNKNVGTAWVERTVIALGTGVSIFTALYVARRFISGTDGRLFWMLDVKWSPPGGAFPVLALILGASLGAVGLLVCLPTELSSAEKT